MDLSIDKLRSLLAESGQSSPAVELKINDVVYKVPAAWLLPSSYPQVVDTTGSLSEEDSTFVDGLMHMEKFLEDVSGAEFTAVSKDHTYSLNISDLASVEAHVYGLLEKFQQLPCKAICKAWIRHLLPKKQSCFPYKAGDAKKPPFWPASCRHREPDHLRKDERIYLMLSIILTRGLVTVSDLKASANECRSMIPKDKLPLLEEIYYVKEAYDKCEPKELAVTDLSKLSSRKRRNIADSKPSTVIGSTRHNVLDENLNVKNKHIDKALDGMEKRKQTFTDENIFLHESFKSMPSIDHNTNRLPLATKDPNQAPHIINDGERSPLATIAAAKLVANLRAANSAESNTLRSHSRSQEYEAPFLSPLELMHVKPSTEVDKTTHGKNFDVKRDYCT